MAVIILMSLVLGAELGPKADPTTTTYVPRPEWYFFFLFELLRVIKPPSLVPLATIGVPTICMILLFLLPFYDRGPERRPERRPIATTAGILEIAAMAFLTYLGANAGSPTEIDMQTPPNGPSVADAGRNEGQAGGRAVGLPGLPQDRRERQRRPGPEPDEHRRAACPRQAIARTLVNPTAPMPSFKDLPPEKFNASSPSCRSSSSVRVTTRRRQRSAARTGTLRRPRCARCSTASRASTTA